MTAYRGEKRKDEIDFHQQVQEVAERMAMPKTFEDLSRLVTQIITENDVLGKLEVMAMAEEVRSKTLRAAFAAKNPEPVVYRDLYQWLQPFGENGYKPKLAKKEELNNSIGSAAAVLPGVITLYSLGLGMVQGIFSNSEQRIPSISAEYQFIHQHPFTLAMIMFVLTMLIGYSPTMIHNHRIGKKEIPREYEPIFRLLLEVRALKDQEVDTPKMRELLARLKLFVENLNKEGLRVDDVTTGRYKIELGDDGAPRKLLRIKVDEEAGKEQEAEEEQEQEPNVKKTRRRIKWSW